MKRWIHSLLCAAILVGQAPAWAMACGRGCAGGISSLACVRICAHSQSLMTQHGKLPSVGTKACGGIQIKVVPASLGVISFVVATASGPDYPLAQLVASQVEVPVLSPIAGRAPPQDRPDQILLSIPSSQAPPARL